jgi:hypothetical protein
MPRSRAHIARQGSINTVYPASRSTPAGPRRRQPAISLPPLPDAAPNLLRVLEGAVIDFPAPVLHPDARRWAATCWPDPTQPGGWGRAIWWPSPYHRGYVPVALDYADVVEFGADIPSRRGRTTRWVPVRWYGLVIERTAHFLIVHGPHSAPPAAKAVADELRGTIARYYSARPRGDDAFPLQVPQR